MRHQHAALWCPRRLANFNRILFKNKPRHQLARCPWIHCPPLGCLLRRRIRPPVPMCQRIRCKYLGFKGVHPFAFSCQSKRTFAIHQINQSSAFKRCWLEHPRSQWVSSKWHFAWIWHLDAHDLRIGKWYCRTS